MISFLDRLFYCGQGRYAHKPAAAVAVARRAGSVASIDVINKYFTIAQMPVVSLHTGTTSSASSPATRRATPRVCKTMRNLARNMAWLLKCIELGRANGVAPHGERPERRDELHTLKGNGPRRYLAGPGFFCAYSSMKRARMAAHWARVAPESGLSSPPSEPVIIMFSTGPAHGRHGPAGDDAPSA